MIELEDGLSLCGRCVWGNHVGYIMAVDRRTYTVHWLDGAITTQLRPDLEDEEEFDKDKIMAQFDAAIASIKHWVEAAE